MDKQDICIVGGGMVGSAVALGMAKLGLKVCVVEPHMPKPFDFGQGPDIRVSAISAQSEKLLNQLGAWQHIQAMRTCAYRRLSVWERHDCRTDFDVKDIHQTHLGHIVENRLIQLGIHKALLQFENVQWVTEQKIVNVKFGQHPLVEFGGGKKVSAQLLVAADGANSFIRQAAGIGTQGWQYAQQAMGILIKTHAPQQDITWQQFTPDGPLAFLPLYDGYASLVWYAGAEKIKHLKSLKSVQLKQHIVAHFPPQLVDFDVLETANFPLTRMHANQYVKDSLVLVGDAAHTINPLAGQGVNLGFKDAAALLDSVEKMLQQGLTVSAPTCLNEYQQLRRKDNLIMMTAMDGLYKLFSNENTLLSGLRNIGLTIADKSGPLKIQVMKYAMGI